MIEFLAQDKALKKDFQRFVHTMGKVREDFESIEAAFAEVYSKDLDALQIDFEAYCKKR
ncbi:hypothetical protein D3C83_293080 [compost metagenome]